MITLTKEKKETDFLRPRETKFYPSDNNPSFEEWFLDNYDESRNKSDYVYLPILVTELNKLYIRNNKTRWAVDAYFKELDKSKKYFLIVQHDDGVLFNCHGANIKVFGMGCKGDIQLPLVCQPHKYEFKENGRPIFASFIGSITHPIRKRLVEELKGKDGYFISTEPTSLESYCYIMSMSKFVLCYRGYGLTSFRIGEALQYGATPVYVSSDGFLIPSGFEGSMILAKDTYEAIQLMSITEPINSVCANKKTFENCFTYEAVANKIYEELAKFTN